MNNDWHCSPPTLNIHIPPVYVRASVCLYHVRAQAPFRSVFVSTNALPFMVCVSFGDQPKGSLKPIVGITSADHGLSDYCESGN